MKYPKCPECKEGDLKYYPDNHYVQCTKCDYRNGFVTTIRKYHKKINELNKKGKE